MNIKEFNKTNDQQIEDIRLEMDRKENYSNRIKNKKLNSRL